MGKFGFIRFSIFINVYDHQLSLVKLKAGEDKVPTVEVAKESLGLGPFRQSKLLCADSRSRLCGN